MTSVLVVEDNPVSRRQMADTLRLHGFDVQEAAGAQGMFDALSQQCPDVVLVDLVLPDGDGLRVVYDARLRINGLQNTAFLACTSETDGLSLALAGYGFCDMLEKPIEPAELLRAVRRWSPRGEGEEPIDGKHRRLLLVDHDNLRLRRLQGRLERMNFEVVPALSYDEALRRLREMSFFALISESQLLDRDGFELVTDARKVASMIPVILLSDSVDLGASELASELGASEVVSRNLESGELDAALLRQLASRSSLPSWGEEAPSRVGQQMGRLLGKHDEVLQQNARLLRRNARLNAQLSILTALSNTIANRHDPEAVFDEVLAILLDTEGFSIGGVVLPGPLFAPGAFCVGCEPERLRRLAATMTAEGPSAPISFLSRQSEPAHRAWELLQSPVLRSVMFVRLQIKQTEVGALVIASERDIAADPEATLFVRGVVSLMELGLTLRQAMLDEQLSRELAHRQRRDAQDQSLLMRAILDSLDEGVITVDSNDRSEHWNKAALAMLGGKPQGDWHNQWLVYREDELKPLPFEQHPLQFLLQGHEDPVDTVLRFMRHGGYPPVWLKVSARRLVDERGVLGSVLQMRDISNERISEQRIRSSRANWTALVEHAPDLIMHVDREGAIQFSNKEAWGQPACSLEGQHALALLPQESRDLWTRSLSNSLETSTATSCEIVVERAAEGERWGSVLFGPIVEEQYVVGFIVIIRDITDRKRREESMLFADRMASVGMLAAGVAHEINNPLTAIGTNLELSRQMLSDRKDPASAELNAMLDDAFIATERVRTIVRDLKIFSRSEEEHSGSVNILDVLETTIRLAWSEIRHRARLIRDFEPVPLVQGNESRLGQVFLNLLANAAQSIPSIGRVDQNEIRIKLRAEPEGVRVLIEDTGIGIPLEVQRRLFTPFFSTKPVGVGTGLGLSICRRIVESHHGDLQLESVPGRGTIVSVLLPRGTLAVAAPPQSLLPARAVGGKVLVIDDEPIITMAVSRILAKSFEVEATQQAQDALALLASGKTFDIILCDLMMPNMSGVDFRDALQREFPHLLDRLFFLTGGAFSAKFREFLDAQQGRYLEKPFKAKALIHFVTDHMGPLG